MTITADPVTVAASISNLSISGVTLRDLDEIPDSANMITPILFPQPSGWLESISPERMSFGSLGNQKENFTYTLNYVFLYSEIGSGINAFAPYKPLIQKLKDVINAILNNDVVSGLVDMQLESITGIGEIQDPSGNPYWGALFSLRCVEYAQ